MKTLYFDCSSGICGNMALGALLEITGDQQYFLNELEKLHLSGYEIKITPRTSHGIGGTHVDVIVDGADEYGHVHHLKNHSHHHHHHRNLHDITHLIDESDLRSEVKTLAKTIFQKVATAESKVHQKPLTEVHFHEVGATDSIIDIVGTAILINQIRPDRILASVVSEGHGTITCAHGEMSVPVPATAEIFASSQVKFRQVDVPTELVTPTGAAIIATLAENYTFMPEMTLEKIGTGVGTKDTGRPNVLKAYYGEEFREAKTSASRAKSAPVSSKNSPQIYVLAANIDDCPGELLGHCLDQLLAAGARDAFFTPIFMKKNRPAYKLEVICAEPDLDKLMSIIFNETTTIGIRYYPVERVELAREPVQVDTPYGKLTCKQVTTPTGQVFTYPEYTSAKALAEKNHLPLKTIYQSLNS